MKRGRANNSKPALPATELPKPVALRMSAAEISAAGKRLRGDVPLQAHRVWKRPPDRVDPLEILRRLGGREVAALAGAILAARLQHIPVILDGYVVTAAAAILHAIHPATIDHCVAGHLSADGAHQDVLERLGKIPLLALGMRLGEGTGAALAAGLVKTAAQVHRDMATFAQAGVSERLPD